MFFVPSVQKPLVSHPSHSSISPLGVSETVQGLSVFQTKLGLAEWEQVVGAWENWGDMGSWRTVQAKPPALGGWPNGHPPASPWPATGQCFPPGFGFPRCDFSSKAARLGHLDSPGLALCYSWCSAACQREGEINSFFKYLITVIFLNTAGWKFFSKAINK